MRLDGALEPRPRYGAAPFKGRFPLRRETREQCESQQQQSADEDDEATDAECLTNDNNNNTIHSRNNINNWPANRANLNLQPATLRTTKQSRAAGSGAGNLKRCSMVATLKTRAPPSLMLMGQKDLHPGSRKARMKAAGSKGARAGRGGAGARAGTGSRSGWERLNSSLVLLLISVIALMPPLTLGDDGDNFFAVNAFSAGPETTTPEFDYASRGQKKFGDKCENTLECGFPGSICDPKKKSCQCTEDLPVTNHIDKCGKGRRERVLFLQRAMRDEILPDGVPGRTLHLPVRDVAHLGQGRLRGVQRTPGQEGSRGIHRSGHDWRAGRNGIDVYYYLCRPAIV
ncbi:uncharacterized protein jus isoform X3 [Drosophila bipectinata]|uniref:uncharacterized protein jus isoform X3 n=1 Tax=Drosophila bipectinata TaxID=42026 RepID=UPI0038B2B33B